MVHIESFLPDSIRLRLQQRQHNSSCDIRFAMLNLDDRIADSRRRLTGRTLRLAEGGITKQRLEIPANCWKVAHRAVKELQVRFSISFLVLPVQRRHVFSSVCHWKVIIIQVGASCGFSAGRGCAFWIATIRYTPQDACQGHIDTSVLECGGVVGPVSWYGSYW